MVYPIDDLAIRARRAIQEATELVERLRRIYARGDVRDRRRMGAEEGDPPPPRRPGSSGE